MMPHFLNTLLHTTTRTSCSKTPDEDQLMAAFTQNTSMLTHTKNYQFTEQEVKEELEEEHRKEEEEEEQEEVIHLPA